MENELDIKHRVVHFTLTISPIYDAVETKSTYDDAAKWIYCEWLETLQLNFEFEQTYNKLFLQKSLFCSIAIELLLLLLETTLRGTESYKYESPFLRTNEKKKNSSTFDSILLEKRIELYLLSSLNYIWPSRTLNQMSVMDDGRAFFLLLSIFRLLSIALYLFRGHL